MTRSRRLAAAAVCLLAVLGALLAPGVPVRAQEEGLLAVEGTERHPLAPPDTSSPRATFTSFLTEGNAAWRADQLERVLPRVRELLLGHERVDEDPARIRLFVRILREVEEAGTALAPPAQTTYLRSGAERPEPGGASPEVQAS